MTKYFAEPELKHFLHELFEKTLDEKTLYDSEVYSLAITLLKIMRIPKKNLIKHDLFTNEENKFLDIIRLMLNEDPKKKPDPSNCKKFFIKFTLLFLPFLNLQKRKFLL